MVAMLAASEGPTDWRLLIATTGLGVAVVTTLCTWSSRRKEADHQHLSKAVADLVNAWNVLRTSTGITAAIESNLVLLRQEDRVAQLGTRRIDKVDAQLRQVTALDRPASPKNLESWLERRYDTVAERNKQLIELVTNTEDRWRLRAQATADAHPSLMEAYSDWDRAAQTCRAAASRWPSLVQCVELTEYHVRAWWVYAVNDPRYWESDEGMRQERRRWHNEAKARVLALQDIVVCRDLGMHPMRHALARTTPGTETLNAIDRSNAMI
ncbi:hypothetical protein [Quadrisphaera granulorum]|uniref:hypothetical protein n=1 Tax=Quadrisphaera granulorum TaxID=317664 RepID=UPI001474BCE2|nr:hypothetical protein [Quadrisphaera granulorum]